LNTEVKFMNTKYVLGFLCAAVMMSSAHAQTVSGDAAAGQGKSAVCAACHGQDGNGVNPIWPKLAGQHEAYLARHIRLIQSGDRQVPEMMGIVANLTAQDIQDLAAFYADKTLKPGVADESLIEQGARIYRAGNAEAGVPACMSCHGPAGQGNPAAGYPVVSGQYAQYTQDILKRYRDGLVFGEGDDANQVMAGVAADLSDEDIQAVASYLEGLH
jgi:cytochrome c553